MVTAAQAVLGAKLTPQRRCSCRWQRAASGWAVRLMGVSENGLAAVGRKVDVHMVLELGDDWPEIVAFVGGAGRDGAYAGSGSLHAVWPRRPRSGRRQAAPMELFNQAALMR